MSRRLAAIVAAGLTLAGVAFAGTALSQTPAAAPATHTATKLTFPPTLGGATLQQSFVNQSGPKGRDASYAYQYLTANRLPIAVYVFDGGRRVPNGSDNPAVVTQFGNEIALAEQGIKSSGFSGFERPAVPSTCTYGAVVFRCIVFSGSSTQGGRLFSKMMLTGYRDYFVKIRIDWAQADGRTLANADQALQAFVPALMR